MLILRGISDEVYRVAFSADSQAVLASGHDGEVGTLTALWDLPGATGPTHRIPGITEALFAPDGATLITLAHADHSSTLSVLDRETMEPVRESRTVAVPEAAWPEDWMAQYYGAPPQTWPAVQDMQLTPNLTRLVAIHGTHTLLWFSWPGLELVPGWDEPLPWAPGALAFAPKGDRLAVYNTRGSIYLLNAISGDVIWETLVYTQRDSTLLTYSANGRFIVAASGTALRVIEADTGEVVARLSQRDRYFYRGLAFTPDGRFLATVSKEGTVKFFDTSSWRVRHEMAWRVGGLGCIAFSRDGMLGAAGSLTGKVVVWDVDL